MNKKEAERLLDQSETTEHKTDVKTSPGRISADKLKEILNKYSGTSATGSDTSKYQVIEDAIKQMQKGQILTTGTVREILVASGKESKWNPERLQLMVRLVKNGKVVHAGVNGKGHNIWRVV